MNPIEHVWDALGIRVAGRQIPPQTLQELERALLEESSPEESPRLVPNIRMSVSAKYRHGLRAAERSIVEGIPCHPKQERFRDTFLRVTAKTEPGADRFCLRFIKNTQKIRTGDVRESPCRSYFCKAIRGSRNSDNVEGRRWNERRMSNVGNNRGNWRNCEVVRRPNNGRNDYRGNYQNSRQGNQWFQSRNKFQNDDRRFNDRGYQFRNRGQNDDFSRGGQRNRGSSENFNRGDRRQMGRLNVLKTLIGNSLVIQDSQVEDIKVDERNLRVYVSETKLNVVANASDKNPVESIIGEKVNCAIIRDLLLSSRLQFIEEQRTDPELGHIYRYLENPEDSSVNAAICENWSRDFRLVECLLFYAKYATSLGEMRVYIPQNL
ncbi:uncharacterized protein TNCV_2675871 [Trichonephila clavipes]|nr:uncharacterized protein TNCV_2675871 [Trichonephila clavipes]